MNFAAESRCNPFTFTNPRRTAISHIVQIKTQIRDAEAARAACRRLGISEPVQKTVKMFDGSVTGLAVDLPGWRYPVVCDTASGQIQFDNYNGRWGEQRELDRFLQAYAVEKAKIEARRKGYGVVEQPLSDGSIKVTIQVNGGAA